MPPRNLLKRDGKVYICANCERIPEYILSALQSKKVFESDVFPMEGNEYLVIASAYNGKVRNELVNI